MKTRPGHRYDEASHQWLPDPVEPAPVEPAPAQKTQPQPEPAAAPKEKE